jgi:hypothetical protein
MLCTRAKIIEIGAWKTCGRIRRII